MDVSEETLAGLYSSVGEDYTVVLARLRKPDRVAKFLTIFAKDTSLATLDESIESGDLETAFRAAHTLKGTSREIGFANLGDMASEVCEALRPDTGAGVEAAMEMMPALRDRYNAAMEAIATNLG